MKKAMILLCVVLLSCKDTNTDTSNTDAPDTDNRETQKYVTTQPNAFKFIKATSHAFNMPHDGVVAATLLGKLYVFRGWHQNTSPTTDSGYWIGNHDLSSFTYLGTMPRKKGHNGSVFIKNDSTAILAGGDILYAVDKEVWMVQAHTGKDSLSFTKIGELPYITILQGYAQRHDTLFIFGGQSDYNGAGVPYIAYSTDWGYTWDTASAPANFGMNMSGTIDTFAGYFWRVAGGVYAPARTYTASLQRSTDGFTWEDLTDAPVLPCAYPQTRTFNGKLFFIGGTNPKYSDHPDGNLSQVWFMDSTQVWHKVMDSTINRMHAAFATIYNNQLVLIGGDMYSNNVWVSDFK